MSIPSYIFAWVALVFFSGETILVKLIGKHSIKNPWLFNFVWSLSTLLIILPFAWWNGVGVPAEWRFIILGSITAALATILYTLTIYNLDVSVASPLFNFRVAIAVLLAAIFLGEILTVKQYVLISIIFIFGIIVSLDENFSIKSFFRKGVLIIIACTVCLAITSIFIKKSIFVTGYWDTTFWILCLAQIWMLATIPFFKNEITRISGKQYGATLLVAFASAGGMLSATAAYVVNVSIATVIIALPISMLAAVIFSRFAPQLLEHHTAKVYVVRFVGAAIMIFAALNL